ncbi:hypothetical protein Ccar_04015 [Clostridium carboxidivorans P7]|uniref:Uncharacterized protein n=1 Tax=Clostridium carboxidivorans P7 TaxID=536227 RepID=C6PRV6_9CLOT|nr:hypothetical protein [Clostridium carboxidivorans]AKN30034.1 hypothetical protein Ccar_04015 [Clostridium carboxidivorans P7]EET88008.1 conserved hypothetical protein [Clostridium carboxidivorans P7]EFG89037.1 hypothetical protein CLCAR_1219 [Clostridium carboxidivorans P7]
MSKYKVGDELIIIQNQMEDEKNLSKLTSLNVKDDFAQISWGLKILDVQYDKPNVTLTYKNPSGVTSKVFAVCNDIENFDQQKVLEKALLKAFQSEIINISVIKNEKGRSM